MGATALGWSRTSIVCDGSRRRVADSAIIARRYRNEVVRWPRSGVSAKRSVPSERDALLTSQ